MQTEPTYWFPAKRYGWGWGFPSSWQGWVVFAAFVGLLVAGPFIFPPRRLKGEPPRWRWGDDARS